MIKYSRDQIIKIQMVSRVFLEVQNATTISKWGDIIDNLLF